MMAAEFHPGYQTITCLQDVNRLEHNHWVNPIHDLPHVCRHAPWWNLWQDARYPVTNADHTGQRAVVHAVVKSGSSGLKSDRGNGREIEVSYRGGPEVRQRYKSGDLVRTWRRLMCHALAKVVVLDFRGTEVQRYGGKRRHEGGL